MKFVEIKGMTSSKNARPNFIDPEVQKRGYQMGFVTPVVHALTYGNWMLYESILSKLTRKFPTWQVMLQSRKSRELTVNLYSCGSYDLI